MNELTEEQLKFLSEELGFKLDTVKRMYEELKTKEVIKNDPVEDRVYDCLYTILFEKSMKESHKSSIQANEKYYATNDYAINKALYEIYGEEAMDDLSEAFINHLTIHPSRDIDYDDENSYTL